MKTIYEYTPKQIKAFSIFFRIISIIIILMGILLTLAAPITGIIAILFGIVFWILASKYKKIAIEKANGTLVVPESKFNKSFDFPKTDSENNSIFNLETIEITGTHVFHDGINPQELIKKLHIGEQVFLKPNPENKYDNYAIKVLNCDMQQIGWIPRGRSAESLQLQVDLFERLCKGMLVLARVEKISKSYDNYKDVVIQVALYGENTTHFKNVKSEYNKIDVSNYYENMDFVSFDVETTGLNAACDEIIQIGAAKFINGVMTDKFVTYVKPTTSISEKVSKINNIYDYMVQDAPDIKEALTSFIHFIGDALLIAHNSDFDMRFIQTNLHALGFEILKNKVIDTLELAQINKYTFNFPDLKLETIKNTLSLDYPSHEALSDCLVCADFYIECFNYFNPKFDEPCDDIYFCSLDEHWYSCLTKGWEVDHHKCYKQDIRPIISKICEDNGGRCFKTIAKSAKYIIILCKPYQNKDVVDKYHNMGYKVVSLDIALKYFKVYEQLEKIAVYD